MRGSILASPLSEVMPRITKPGLLGLCSWTSKPGTKRATWSNSSRPSSRRVRSSSAERVTGTSCRLCSRFCTVTVMVFWTSVSSSPACWAKLFGARPRRAAAETVETWAKRVKDDMGEAPSGGFQTRLTGTRDSCAMVLLQLRDGRAIAARCDVWVTVGQILRQAACRPHGERRRPMGRAACLSPYRFAHMRRAQGCRPDRQP